MYKISVGVALVFAKIANGRCLKGSISKDPPNRLIERENPQIAVFKEIRVSIGRKIPFKRSQKKICRHLVYYVLSHCFKTMENMFGGFMKITF